VAIEAHEVTDEGREAGSGEEPPLAALHTPVLVPGEIDMERGRADDAYRSCRVRRLTAVLSTGGSPAGFSRMLTQS